MCCGDRNVGGEEYYRTRSHNFEHEWTGFISRTVVAYFPLLPLFPIRDPLPVRLRLGGRRVRALPAVRIKHVQQVQLTQRLRDTIIPTLAGVLRLSPRELLVVDQDARNGLELRNSVKRLE